MLESRQRTAVSHPESSSRQCLAAVLATATLLVLVVVPGTAQTPIGETLQNGVRTLIAEDHHIPVVTLGLWIKAGRAHNPEGREGVADIAAQQRFRAVNQLLDRGALGRAYMAGALTVAVMADHTRFTLSVLPEDVSIGLDVLRALIPGEDDDLSDVPSLKVTALRGLEHSRFDHGIIAREAFARATCGTQRPLGRSATFASVYGIRTEHVSDFFRDHYAAGAMLVSAAGSIERPVFRNLVGQRFGDLRAAEAGGAPLAQTPLEAPAPGVLLVDDPNSERALIIGGVAGPGRDSGDYGHMQLLHLVLAGAGPSTAFRRLVADDPAGQELLAELRPSARGSYLTLEARVSHDRAPQVLAALRRETTADSILAIPDLLVQALLNARRGQLAIDGADPDAAFTRSIPFILAGRSDDRPGALAAVDIGEWRSFVSQVLDRRRQAWIIVGRASELAPRLTDSGVSFETSELLAIATGSLEEPSATTAPNWKDGSVPMPVDIVNAETLLLRALEARGGFVVLESKHSYQAELTLYRKLEEDLTIRSNRLIRARFPDRYREDWGMAVPTATDSTQKLTVVRTINGDEVWRSQLGRETPANERTAHNTRNQFWRDPMAMLLRYGNPGVFIRTVEPEVIGGMSLPGIELRSSNGFWVRLYLHPESNQIAKRVYETRGRRAATLVEEIHTDYREVDDVYLPFVTAVFESGEYVGENHIESVEFNVDLDDDIFERSTF